jgi:hypothetical protein
LSWPRLRDYRDTMIRHLDDTKQVAEYEQQGATVIKGTARLAGPGRVEVVENDGAPGRSRPGTSSSPPDRTRSARPSTGSTASGRTGYGQTGRPPP